jgi:hypothetical protein
LGTLSAPVASPPPQTLVRAGFPIAQQRPEFIAMTPEDHTAAIHALQNAISEIKAILNNGIRTMVNDQKSELATVKDDIQSIRDALTSHVAKEESSRAGEFHPHALSEPYVSLSTHTAPSIRPFG